MFTELEGTEAGSPPTAYTTRGQVPRCLAVWSEGRDPGGQGVTRFSLSLSLYRRHSRFFTSRFIRPEDGYAKMSKSQN